MFALINMRVWTMCFLQHRVRAIVRFGNPHCVGLSTQHTHCLSTLSPTHLYLTECLIEQPSAEVEAQHLRWELFEEIPRWDIVDESWCE